MNINFIYIYFSEENMKFQFIKTILSIGDTLSLNKNVIESWVENSKIRKNWIWDKLNKIVLSKKPNSIVSILGLAYKENTNSIKNSPSINLINKLKKNNLRIHDPVVDNKKVLSSQCPSLSV